MDECKRVALYGRVSKNNGDGDARSVDDQLAELRRWAEHTDVEVVAELRDDGISASRFAAKRERPGWQQVLDLLAAGKIDALAVWEVSRSTRDRAVWAALVAGLIDAGAKLIVNGKAHDPTDPDDGFTLDLAAALAVRESAMTSKRVARSVASRAAAGEPHGPLVYGLRVEYDPTTGRPARRVVDEQQAAVVREATRRILGGETPTAIANDFNRRNIPSPTGRRWIGNNLLRTISAPALAGLRVHRGQVLDGVIATWPAVLTVDEHRRLQQIRHDPGRRTIRNGAHVKHLLTGIARCGVCGGPIGTITRKHVAERVVTYRCRAKFCVSRRADEVDELVEAVVIARLARPDLAAALVASANDPAVHEAAEEVARLRAKLDEARRLVDTDRLSLESLADLEARTLPKLRAAEERARPKHVPSVLFETAGADAAEDRARPKHVPGVLFDTAGADAAERWAVTPISARREIVRTLVDVRLARAPRRGKSTPFDPSSVEIIWRET